MDLSTVLTYISFTFFLVLTPGATTAVVIRNTVERGFRGGVSTAAGAAIANTTHATAACLGLTMVFQRFPNVNLRDPHRRRDLLSGGSAWSVWYTPGAARGRS